MPPISLGIHAGKSQGGRLCGPAFAYHPTAELFESLHVGIACADIDAIRPLTHGGKELLKGIRR
ncbi:MAG: hypothetical protein ACP5I8_00735 [Phycisphaerae bacterium]